MQEMVGGPDQDQFWKRWTGWQTHQQLSAVYRLGSHIDTWKRPEDVHELRGVLVMVRTLQAQVPQDRLYSLYTIFKQFCPEFPEPNYSVPPSTLWATATSAIAHSTRSLDLILDVHHEDRADHLPSWSFDWGPESRENFNPTWAIPDHLLLQKGPTGTAWDQAPKFEQGHDNNHAPALRIKGKICTKVGKKSPEQKKARQWVCSIYHTLVDPEATVEFSNIMGDTTQILFEWAIPRAGSAPPTRFDAEEICQNLLVWSRISEEDCYNAFNSWYPEVKRLNWIQADESLNEPQEWLAAMVHAMLRKHGEKLAERFHDRLCLERLFRCFFTTEDGRIGDGFHTVKEGDLVVLLCWSKVPAILRPMKEDPSLYQLVCFAYVHGLVDCHTWNLKEEDLQEFTLV